MTIHFEIKIQKCMYSYNYSSTTAQFRADNVSFLILMKKLNKNKVKMIV